MANRWYDLVSNPLWQGNIHETRGGKSEREKGSDAKASLAIVRSEKEQDGLLHITRCHRSEQQVVLRAQIVLAAAQGTSNAQIARALSVHVDTVCAWRDRRVERQGIDLKTVRILERRHDTPHPGGKVKCSANNAVRWQRWPEKEELDA